MEGYTAATSIEPDTPYIISVPNNPQYDSKFNVTGYVTFSATSSAAGNSSTLVLPATPKTLKTASCTAYTLHSNYNIIPADPSVYVINSLGTQFEANAGKALPCHPYATANGNPLTAPAFFAIGEEGGGATAIEEATLMGRNEAFGKDTNGLRVYSCGKGNLIIESAVGCDIPYKVIVYGVDGRAVRTVSLQEGTNLVDGLAAGVYLVKGMKAIVE